MFFNLIVIAVAAGITEEFLFGGALQRIIGKWTYNHHIIIWSAAIIFSTFHMQFFGFLPRMLLGAYFGYLLYWTRNIWIPVFAHFVNNAIAVISMSDAKLKDNEFITGDISTQNLLPYTIVAIVALFFFVRCCRKLKIIRSSNLILKIFLRRTNPYPDIFHAQFHFRPTARQFPEKALSLRTADSTVTDTQSLVYVMICDSESRYSYVSALRQYSGYLVRQSGLPRQTVRQA